MDSTGSLYDKLIKYSREDYYPMHMPGHKRNTGLLSMAEPYALDITEIEGFDNLHQSEGILKQLAERFAGLYNAGKTYLLVNGSTAGLLAGISAATGPGDGILIARNSHKAVYHAVSLKDVKPYYIHNPSFICGILSSRIEESLIKHPDIKLVVITSPTYEGIISDINKIQEVVHRYGALLLVDEAHGAHLGFHKGFPETSVRLGADIVIQSIHKTLPAFTQTALLHSNREELNPRIEKYLSIYQSSSPSYILMAAMDRCASLLEEKAEELFEDYYQRLRDFYTSVRELKVLSVLDDGITEQTGIFRRDPSKIIVLTGRTGLNGQTLSEILRTKYHIVMEMAAKDYALGMTSICDTAEGFNRLRDALFSIDRDLYGKETGQSMGKPYYEPAQSVPRQVMTPYQAMELQKEKIKLKDSGGKVSASFVSLYPPGSPLIVPGEIIEQDFIQCLQEAKQTGITITGLSGDNKNEIEIIAI